MTVHFLVEGHSERLIIKRLCPKLSVELFELNGKTVTARRIAQEISNRIQYRPQVRKFILLIDKERRKESASDVIESIYHAYETLGGLRSQLIIGMPDRTIENWLVADRTALARYLKCEMDDLEPYRGDGSSGLNQIERIFKSQDKKYSKVSDPPALAHMCRASEIASNSPSFARFFSLIDVDCYWVGR